jgi:hypothetical protein
MLLDGSPASSAPALKFMGQSDLWRKGPFSPTNSDLRAWRLLGPMMRLSSMQGETVIRPVGPVGIEACQGRWLAWTLRAGLAKSLAFGGPLVARRLHVFSLGEWCDRSSTRPAVTHTNAQCDHAEQKWKPWPARDPLRTERTRWWPSDELPAIPPPSPRPANMSPLVVHVPTMGNLMLWA